MLHRLDLTPVARLEFSTAGTGELGWHIRYLRNGQPACERLAIEVGADAFGAVEVAAARLGCRPEQIEVEGPFWPQPLDGLVPADETLEYVSPSQSTSPDGSGCWRRWSGHRFVGRREQRQRPRHPVGGVWLTSPASGRVLNWSEIGLGVEVWQPLQVDTRRLFKTQGRRPIVDLLGDVRWCLQVESPDPYEPSALVYRAGITLIDSD